MKNKGRKPRWEIVLGQLAAEEIYEMVKADYPEIGLATVYRTIQILLELHLIDRINLDDGFVRYEIGNVGMGTA